MNFKVLCQISLFSTLLLSGCSSVSNWWDSRAFDDTEIEECTIQEKNSVSQQVADVPNIVAPEELPDDFIDYRRTATDYKEFGERTAVDRNIYSNGIGSNMSATIPPTIDEEVSDYEEELNTAMNSANSGQDAQGGEGNGSNNGSNDSEDYSGSDEITEDWLAEEGSTLKNLLSEWCERAGWRLIWNSNRNYTLKAGAMFRGRFADVASALVRSFARAKPAPTATFYKGNRVLVIETMEDENAFE